MKTITFCVAIAALCLAPPAAFAADKPGDAPLVPPGWSGAKAGDVLCPRCIGQGFDDNVGRCGQCGAQTPHGAIKLCRTHALEQKKCAVCAAAFPAEPTPGLRLEITWLKPDLNIKDNSMKTNNTESVPIWVTVVNTSDKDIKAPDFLESGGRPETCTTLLFIAESPKGSRVLFNVSPKIMFFRAPAPLTFKPGATSFECDLAKCWSQTGKLDAASYTVRAAVGWLTSNELRLTVAGGGGDAPVAIDPKVAADVGKLAEACQKAMAEGQFAAATEMAKRVAAVQPEVGKKLLAMIEAYAKERSKEDIKRAVEQKALQEKMMREEEMKKRQIEDEMRRRAEEEMRKNGGG